MLLVDFKYYKFICISLENQSLFYVPIHNTVYEHNHTPRSTLYAANNNN